MSAREEWEMNDERPTSDGTALWRSKGKEKVSWGEDGLNSVDDNYSGASSLSSSSSDSYSLETTTCWSSDESSSLGETSSRASTSSGISTSSSNGQSSRTSNSYGSSSSPSSRSRTRSRRSKRSVPCIRTVFSGEELEFSRKNFDVSSDFESTGHESWGNETTSASEDAFSSSSDRLSRLPLSLIANSMTGNDIHQRDRNEAYWREGDDYLEKRSKSTSKKLRQSRHHTNLINFKPQSDYDFLSGQQPQSMLVDVNVLGSPGPIRLVVERNELVQNVMKLALQVYDCQKRQPPLGLSHRPFILYCQTPEFEDMDEKSCVGNYGARHLYLYPKPESDESEEEPNTTPFRRVRGASKYKPRVSRAWFKLSFAEVQLWGSCMTDTLSKNFGYLTSSLYRLNLGSILGAMLNAFR